MDAMIALVPLPAEAEALSVDGGHEPEQIHVTVVFVPEVGAGDLPTLQAVARVLAEELAPVDAVVSGITEFEGAGVTVALVDGPELPDVHHRAVELLEEAGVRVSREHGFTPHATLYEGEGRLDGEPGGSSLHLHELWLSVTDGHGRESWGNVLDERLPLRGVQVKSLAELRADLRQDRWEGALQGVLQRLLDSAERVALEKLQGPKVRRGTPYFDPPGDGDVDVEQLFDRTRWVQQLAQEGTPVLRDLRAEVFAEAGVTEAKALGEAGWLQRMLGVLDGVEQELQEAVLERPGTLQRLLDSVRGVFRRARQRGLAAASDVALGASNEASLEAAERSKTVVLKQWVTRRDDKVRSTHRAVDGRTVPMGELFQVGASRMQYPHDPAGEVGETINCRCRLRYFVASGVEKTLEDLGLETKNWRESDHPRGPGGRFVDVLRVGNLHPTERAKYGRDPRVGLGKRIVASRTSRNDAHDAWLQGMPEHERYRAIAAETRIKLTRDQWGEGDTKANGATPDVDLQGLEAADAEAVAQATADAYHEFPWLAEVPPRVSTASFSPGVYADGRSGDVLLSDRLAGAPEAYRTASDAGFHPPVAPGTESRAIATYAYGEAAYETLRFMEGQISAFQKNYRDDGEVDRAIQAQLWASGSRAWTGVRSSNPKDLFSSSTAYWQSAEARELVRRELGEYAASAGPRYAVGAALVNRAQGREGPIGKAILDGMNAWHDSLTEGAGILEEDE